MTQTKKILSILLIVSFLVIPKANSSAQSVPVLANGALVRAQGDDKLYYIDNGKKRHIDSPETYRRQGFFGAIQDIPALNLALYPEGDVITKNSIILFPGETETAPDITPFAASDIQLVNRDGRKLLLFTAKFWNEGRGPLELNATSATQTADDVYETAQHIVFPNGTYRNKVVGNLFWHDIHKHFHFNDFASYVLEMVPQPKVAPTTTVPVATAAPATPGLTPISAILGVSTQAPEIVQKSTFCIYETERIPLPTPVANNTRKTYTTCGKYKQGISVGWADKYNYTLPDQNFDVTDLPAGIYRLAFVLDPLQNFMESSRTNNSSVAFVEINPTLGTMRVLASGSPFVTPANYYPNGMLVRSESSADVYVLQNNKKQRLQTAPIGQVFILPQGVFDAIPTMSLIKATGSPTVYMLNESGFRRGISSIEIFNSYGLKWQDLVEVSTADLMKYPETDLIKRQGDDTVYSLSTRRSVGNMQSLGSLQLNSASVHTINQVDFETYMVDVVATDLFVPWDITFLPDGDMLVPERSGVVRRIGKNPGVITVPAVFSNGEGGQMGIALHPKFAENNLIYLYYTTSTGPQRNRVMRFRLDGNQLADQTVILDNIPSAIYHDGGRVAFGPDGMLYITTGDANTPALAQDLNSLAGKTLRLTADGEIPADNPFGTAVWSYGHRNSQGIAWDNLGRLWETEHGRSGALSGFDELNLIEKGKNYGWPTIQGNETRTGMVTPVLNSGANETWAPAGLAFINGSLYFAGLLGSSLYQVNFRNDGSVIGIRSHLKGQFGRLRAVVPGPEGALYVTTSNKDGRGTPRGGDDKILRIRPGFLQSFQ
jgi:glucose/arabinose dehydrogenase